MVKNQNWHCVKSVQIRSFFWSVFFRIHTEYGKIRTRKNAVFGHISHSVCYLDTDSFTAQIKTDDKYIVEDVETRFHTSNYELDRLLHKRKNKKVTGLMKDELDEKL